MSNTITTLKLAIANRIGERIEQIADFIGTTTEQQKATQLRLEALEEKDGAATVAVR